MTSFPLADLPLLLLEMVVLKLDTKGYFRLQQTCHNLEEFVQTNRNLYTHVEKNSSLKWIQGEDGSYRLLLRIATGTVDVTGHYGLRLGMAAPPNSFETGFKEFCDTLKKHRITCSFLRLNPLSGEFKLTREQCAEFIKIMRPVRLQMNSEGSNRFEVLIHSEGLKEVNLFEVRPSNASYVMETCLLRQRKAGLYISKGLSNDPDVIVNLILSVCQVLHSHSASPPNLSLQEFELDLHWDATRPFHEQLLEQLQNYKSPLIRKIQAETRGMRYYIAMPGESWCDFVVETNFACMTFTQSPRH